MHTKEYRVKRLGSLFGDISSDYLPHVPFAASLGLRLEASFWE